MVGGRRGIAGWVSWTLSFLDKQDTILVSYYPWGWSTGTCTWYILCNSHANFLLIISCKCSICLCTPISWSYSFVELPKWNTILPILTCTHKLTALPVQTQSPSPLPNQPSNTPPVLSLPSVSMGSVSGGGISNDSRKPKTRTSINPQQLEVLLETYSREQRPSKPMREELMAKTGLDMKVIQVWFQNRRSKEKRDASYREAM